VPKKFFLGDCPPFPYLRVWMTTIPPYLKARIRTERWGENSWVGFGVEMYHALINKKKGQSEFVHDFLEIYYPILGNLSNMDTLF